jgi:hypothetical protein
MRILLYSRSNKPHLTACFGALYDVQSRMLYCTLQLLALKSVRACADV